MQKYVILHYIPVWKYAHIYGTTITLNNDCKYGKNLKYCIYHQYIVKYVASSKQNMMWINIKLNEN